MYGYNDPQQNPIKPTELPPAYPYWNNPVQGYPVSGNYGFNQSPHMMESGYVTQHAGSAPETFGNFDDKTVRKNFVTKVYFLLTLQLVATALIVCLFRFVNPLAYFLRENYVVFYVISLVIFIPVFFSLVCCFSVARSYPINMCLLALLTLAMGIMLSVICIRYKVDTILFAMGVVIILVCILTMLAAFSNIDFTKLYMLALVAVLVLVLMGFAASIVLFVNRQTGMVLHVIYAGLGVLVFSLFIVIDTQQILGGKRHEISPEDYIAGTLMLYMSIINLFLMVLQLLGFSNE